MIALDAVNAMGGRRWVERRCERWPLDAGEARVLGAENRGRTKTLLLWRECRPVALTSSHPTRHLWRDLAQVFDFLYARSH